MAKRLGFFNRKTILGKALDIKHVASDLIRNILYSFHFLDKFMVRTSQSTVKGVKENKGVLINLDFVMLF